jgi:hypothetical protein
MTRSTRIILDWSLLLAIAAAVALTEPMRRHT